MDVARLTRALSYFDDLVTQSDLLNALQNAVGSSRLLVTAAHDLGNVTQFKKSLEAVDRALASMESHRLPAGTEMAVSQCGGAAILPTSLRKQINDAMAAAGPSAVELQTSLQRVHQTSVAIVAAFQAALTSLRAIGIQPHAPDPSQCEVGVFIPSSLTGDDLEKVCGQLQDWARSLHTIQEVSSGRVGQLHLTGVESGSFDFHVLLDLEGAKALLVLISGVAAMFGIREKWNKHRKELLESEVPQTVIDALDEGQRQLRGTHVDRTTDLVLDAAKSDIDEGRKNELRMKVKVSVEFICDSMEHGVRIELLPPCDSATIDNSTEPDPDRALRLEVTSLLAKVDSDLRRIESGSPSQRELGQSASA